MDILDIDEILKDDSFFLIADNSQDDVTNILQQWRLNSSNSAQGTIFDTRTFTRPKRRSGLNLETNFGTGSSKQDSIMNSSKNNNNNNNINLKVGGLVTSMQKSFLNDTSPPSSICSSMDVSTERMNNSLITSGDFTNVSFFNTNSDDLLSDAHFSGYNLNDVIKDRKFLENLSLSGDSTIIKDSNIAQTDEISYLSKTNSGNSTMHNSTESMTNGINETYVPLNQTIEDSSCRKSLNAAEVNEIENIATKLKLDTKIYDDDLLKDTTFSLVDSLSFSQKENGVESDVMNATVIISHPDHNSTFSTKNHNILNSTFDTNVDRNVGPDSVTKTLQNETFDKIKFNNRTSEVLDLEEEDDIVNEMNVTFDNVGKDPKNLTFDECGTPKSESKSGLRKQCQSTPHQKPFVRKPLKDSVNISPIVPAETSYTTTESPSAQISSDMTKSKFDRIEKYLKDMSDNFINCEDPEKNDHNFENDIKNETFNNSIALLDGGSNEDEFDDMLDQIGKNTISAEAIKMRQSLDNIKKRYSLATAEKTPESKQNGDSNTDSTSSMHGSMGKSSLLSSSGSERLLSRRSRLFDDIKIVANEQPTNEEKKNNTNGKTDNELMDNKSKTEEKTENTSSTKDDVSNEDNPDNEKKVSRRHDRDRFKTIRIFRNENSDLNVPCIDDMPENQLIEEQQPIVTSIEKEQRFSRRDQNSPTVVDNTNLKQQKEINIYQTYKIPKESALKKPIPNLANEVPKANETGRQRSLSRPKHYSGQSKLHPPQEVLPKANSAGDLDTLKAPKMQQRNMGNFGFSSKMPRIKQSSQPSLAPHANHDKYAQPDRSSRSSLLSKPSSAPVDDTDHNGTFKVPHPISNLRAPNSRRAGLVRPSSGFYCYNVNRNDSDNESGRYSPSNSISSASSKGSIQDIQQKCLNGHMSDDNVSNESLKKESDALNQTKLLAGKSTIPKPSGLRPPTNIRKSGLPRPASVVKR